MISSDRIFRYEQLTTTVVMSKLLPVGVLGIFTAAMLAAQVSTDDTYMHSWGSIFVQDVIVPLRKKHFLPAEQVKYLKMSICGVGVFAFLFSLLFPQNDYVMMYLAMTGTIWLGGAGAVIIGGLYWKKGTTLGAYGALITGIVFAVISFSLPRIWSSQGREFPLNSQWLWFISMLSSSVVYVILSLVRNENYNLDKLLHRGVYKVQDENTSEKAARPVHFWQRLMGVTDDFKLSDKIMYFGIAGYILLVCVILIFGTIYNLAVGVPDAVWKSVWHIFVWMTIILSALTTVWFIIGGFKDVKNMFFMLKTST
ncbi:sodium:solute symporter, partial [Candidatus Nomurabacteria bacterium]|nr:sodium:solute symporter [Candidatus Nomurabacteria bacterium]